MRSKNLKVLTAYDEKIIEELPMNTENEADKMLATARKLADNPKKSIPIPQRIEILEKAQNILKDRYNEVVQTAVKEGGKPLIDTEVEITRSVNGFKVTMEEIGNMRGTEIPMNLNQASLNRMAYTFREPIGVVAAICAFNHPFNLAVHQVLPAIAVGCPVIIKPASSTPLSAINLIKILHEAGLPKQWAQVLIADNEVSEKFVTDSRVNFMTFIGSGRVGWYLRSKVAPGVRCELEHGGAAPVIVEPDADLDDALPLMVKGGLYHAGQVCVSVQRVFAHKSITRKVSNGLVRLSKKMNIGDPLKRTTDIGPLISPREVDRVHDWVKEAVKKGGKLLCGGNKIGKTCYEPTVILDPPQNCNLSRYEIFGPVIAAYTYNKLDEAISLANSLPLSFQASVFTKNIDTALDCVKRVNAKSVIINDHTAFRVDWMPFGGNKESGLGTGGIPYTMHEMTQEKMMVIRSNVL